MVLQLAIEIGSKVLCFSLLIFQGILLNAFLAKLHSNSWWGWCAADVLILVVWSVCLAIVWNSFIRTKRRMQVGDHVDGRDPEQSPDEIKYAYAAWLVYVIFLCPRILLIFMNLDGKIKFKDFLGENMLKVATSCTPLVYLSLVYGFHNAEPMTSRKLFIQSIASSGTLDLFDSLDLLELLFEKHRSKFPSSYSSAILFFASVNWFLPTLGLYGIRIKTKTGRVASLCLKATNVICVMAFVNIPNLVIRAVLWAKYDADVSVLIMKNIMCLFLSLYEILEYFGEKPPIKCAQCGDYYENKAYSKHRQSCILYGKSVSIHSV